MRLLQHANFFLFHAQLQKVYTHDDDDFDKKMTIIKFGQYGLDAASVTLKFLRRHGAESFTISHMMVSACFRPGRDKNHKILFII